MKYKICPLDLKVPEKQIPNLLTRLETEHLIDPTHFKKSPEMELSHTLNESQIATYLFTSGTTGSPKIACHSIGNHFFSAIGSNHHLKLNSHDRWQLSLPLFHIGGIAIIMRTFIKGASLIISDTIQPQLSLNPTYLSLVPTQLQKILHLNPHGLKKILLGGDVISPSLYEEGMKRGFPLELTYGMTEMSSQIISGGYLLPFRECKITQDQEILVRGKTLFLGYYSKKDKLTLPVDKEGWFSTKDLGKISSKFGIEITARSDRLFISGGENIQPEEIENALYKLPGIIEAYIIPIKDKTFGSRPIAIIYSKVQYKESKLRDALQETLPKYKIPIAFYTSSNSFKQGGLKLNLQTLQQWVENNKKLYKI